MDEESSLSLIENQEFVAMRAAQKVWLAPTTSEDQLRELISDGLIQSKVIAEWRVPGEHQVLSSCVLGIVDRSKSWSCSYFSP